MANEITAAKQAIGKGGNLYLSEHDGAMWATNRYWLTRAERVGALLDRFNVALDKAGAYEVGTAVRRTGDEKPAVACHLKLSDYPAELSPVKTGERQAYAKAGDGEFAALYETPDGETVAVHDAQLCWLSELTSTAHLRNIYAGDHISYGDRRLMHGSHGAVAIVADITATRAGTGMYGDNGKYVPAKYDDKGTEIISILMPVKLP